MTPTQQRTLSATEAATQLPDLVEAVSRDHERIVIEGQGALVAAIISIADLRRLEAFEQERRAHFAPLEASWAAFADVPLNTDEIEREVAAAVAEVRAEAVRNGQHGV